MAKRLSSNEKKLKILLSENGGLTILQNELSSAIKQHPNKNDIFDLIEKVLIAVSKFQDANHHKMDKVKTLFKDNEKIMLHLGPLHNSIKKCGRGIWKSEKHKSFVLNKAGIIKKNRISRKITYEVVNGKKIFLTNDYYTSAQRLTFVKEQSEHPSSPSNKAMVEELIPLLKHFIDEHYNKISSGIENLKKLF